ncbi:set and mynd domain-containing protein [Dermatophagoides farinae]|uniref:Set and mynd domain-containing protein n=1 Tax=Dermatophagoides farinae TaxID=6954 RepID=A0A9D4NV40_DERFA|nr:N-lysine methyltransferase SMYD2-A-like isoform X1 [Dermatophagoides farinae]KAH7638836.1 set and mynd domain-containing protein [Dermatophagoides farinae]
MISHRDYKAGEIISVNPPFVHAIDEDKKGKYCDYCLAPTTGGATALGKCSNCKHMYYCGKDCQRNDWKQHKFECKIFKKSYEIITDEFDRFLLRLYLFVKNNPECVNERQKFINDENSNRCFNDLLMTDWNRMQNDSFRISDFETICTKFQFMKIEFNRTVLFKFYCISCSKFLKIVNYELEKLGAGLYIAESQIGHSCTPNSAQLFNGNQIVMRAIKPIKSGTQITVSYVDMIESRYDRQTKLAQYFNITCECQRCNSVDPVNHQLLKEFIMKLDILYLVDKFKAYKLGTVILSMLQWIYTDYHPAIIIHIIHLLQICHEIALENGDNERIGLSVAAMAQHVRIELPDAYKEIFENTYFNQPEDAQITIMKALANVD